MLSYIRVTSNTRLSFIYEYNGFFKADLLHLLLVNVLRIYMQFINILYDHLPWADRNYEVPKICSNLCLIYHTAEAFAELSCNISEAPFGDLFSFPDGNNEYVRKRFEWHQ